MRTIFLAAAALAAVPALAQEPPTPIGLSVEYQQGTLDGPGDVDAYSFKLAKGQDIALGGWAENESTSGALKAELVAPGGQVVRSFEIVTDGMDSGVEYRAPKAGTYVARVSGVEASYWFRVTRDCPDSAKTTCTIKLGATLTHYWTSWYDIDQLKLSLAAGRTYTLTATSEEGGPLVQILDASQKILVDTGYQDPTAKAVYKPRKSGTYYARIITANDERGYPYKVTLTKR